MIQLPEVDTDDKITDDEDFLEFTLLITFPRNRRIYQDHANHFEMYDDSESFDRFHLFKPAVHHILNIIQSKISSATIRYVT